MFTGTAAILETRLLVAMHVVVALVVVIATGGRLGAPRDAVTSNV